MAAINYNEEDQKQTAAEQEQDLINGLFIGNMVEGIRKQRLNTEKNVILLWVLSQQAHVKGHKQFVERFEWLLENRALLLKPETGHSCPDSPCDPISAKPGQLLHYVLTNETFNATGDVFVCSMTGAAHICCGMNNCSATVIDRNDQRAGYHCAITSRAKHQNITSVAGYNADRPVGRDTLNKQIRDEEDGMNANTGAEDFDMDGDGNDPEEMVTRDNEYVDELFEKKRDDQTNMLETPEENLRRMLDWADKAANQKVSLTVPVHRKPPPPLPRPQRKVKTLTEMTADERVAVHLKDLDKKQALARSIVRFVLSFDNQCRLYVSKMKEVAEKATARVNSQISKAKRCLTSIDCDNIFLRFMMDNSPRRPGIVAGLYFGRYVNAIMQMWCTVSQSPYARTVIMRKQRPLKFDKIAFGLLYKIAGGGYTINCSLPAKVLQHFSIAKELPDLYAVVKSYQVHVISHDPAIAAAIVDSSQLVPLRSFSYTNAQPDSKTVNEGFKLLENCYKSIFKELVMGCIKQLQNGEDKRLVVQAYLEACISKKVPSTSDTG